MAARGWAHEALSLCVGVRVRVGVWFGVEVGSGSHFGSGEEDGGGGDRRNVWIGGGTGAAATTCATHAAGTYTNNSTNP